MEPVREMRECGHAKGLTAAELVEGDATKLDFADGEFDVVCAFGILHHIQKPSIAIGEMLRVARRMVFISDGNNFGQGGRITRMVKQVVNAIGLWQAANWVKTRGRGYSITEADGLAYSYSLFNNYRQIHSACEAVHLFNTGDSATPNLYRSAAHVALAGLKKQ